MERSKPGEFNWIDLSARDFDAQSAFYEGLFGWGHTDIVPPVAELEAMGIPSAEGMTYRMFNSGGHNVGGMSQLSRDLIAQGMPSAWNTYVATDDVDATVVKAADLGGTVVMPPMDVTGSGRMAGIQDPTGAYIFFWKPLLPDETIEYFQPGTLSWTDLTTRDPEKAVAFYTELLGWDVQPMEESPMPYWQVSVEGQGEGGIMSMPDLPAEVPSFWMPYFGTTDIAASFAKAVELGATVMREPTEISGMLWFAVLADTAGATFALLQALGAPEA
jgi:predicted enzyme related to lactoylglutathione lyase